MVDEPKTHHVYCDESQTSGARFTVYGGIIIPANSVPVFDDVIAQWRLVYKMNRELKWERVSKQKYAEYQSLVDLFFEHVAAKFLSFKAVVFDTHDRYYRRDRRDKDAGFYKLYYHFLLYKFGPYAHDDEHRLYVFLDERSTLYKLDVLCIILNRGIKKRFYRTVDVVKVIEPRDSKKCNLIQVADVIMGAIGYHSNDLHRRRDAGKHKVNLADYIAKKAGLRTLKEGTSPRRVDFEIWRWKSPAARQK